MAGHYDASTGSWTQGATYSLTRVGNNFAVTGVIPYGEADAVFGEAGNRFAVRVYNHGIDERSDLPTGIIARTTNKNVASGYNTSTRADFEDDGSLIAIFAPTAENKNAYNREIKIKWFAGEDFTVYTFDLTNATLQVARTITTTVTNGTYSGATKILSGSTASVTLAAGSGFELPSEITVTGASYTYNQTTGVVSLSNPTANVTINATCVSTSVTLTAIENGASVPAVQFDKNLTIQQVKDIIDGVIDEVDEGVDILFSYNDDTPAVAVANADNVYNIIVVTGFTTGEGEEPEAVEVEVFNSTDGWSDDLDASGKIAINITPTPTAKDLNEATGWNGVLIGVAEE